MKLTKYILPIAAILMVFAVVESNAQICVYKEGEEYSLEDAIRYKGDNLKFIKFCCDSLKICTGNYPVDEHYYLTHVAAKYNRTSVLKYLIEDKHLPKDSLPVFVREGQKIEKQTPAMMGAENASLDSVKYLVDGAGVNVAKKNPDGKDTLYYAEKSRNQDMISYVKSVWEKAVGISAARVEKNKKDLIRVLTLNDIKDEIRNFQRDIKFNGFFS